MPVAVVPSLDKALPLAETLRQAGLNHIEITLRTECALEAMAAIRKEFPDMTVCAGTILSPEIVPQLVDMGIAFGVSPGLNPAVVEKAQSLGFQMMPGVMTPTEIEQALGMGLKVLKFFPAQQAGGAKMLKALEGPYGHTGVKFIPTGGINESRMEDYLDLDITLAIGGSWFVDKMLIAYKDFEQIGKLTREAIKLAKKRVGPRIA